MQRKPKLMPPEWGIVKPKQRRKCSNCGQWFVVSHGLNTLCKGCKNGKV